MFDRILYNQLQLISLRDIKNVVSPRLVKQMSHLAPRPSKADMAKAIEGYPAEGETYQASSLDLLVELRRTLPLAEQPSPLDMLFQLRRPDPPKPKAPPLDDLLTSIKENRPLSNDDGSGSSSKGLANEDFLRPFGDMLTRIKEIQSMTDY